MALNRNRKSSYQEWGGDRERLLDNLRAQRLPRPASTAPLSRAGGGLEPGTQALCGAREE